ncbi:MAG: sorbosone dehydrogenase family protein [Acidobacteria bacterium]|nr:sorbosone dehydrogenase family protein [Acidobacteriota bacterium]
MSKISLAVLIASASLIAWQGPVKLPPPFHTPSATNRPRPVERPEGAKLNLPPGFTIKEFASGFQRPRHMILGPSKEILLSDSMVNGSVFVLNGDNKSEILKNLDRPYGLLLLKDYLYVGETTSLKRYKYNPKTMTAGPGEEILNMKDFSAGHWTRSLTADRKGEHIFVGIGSRSNVDAGEPEMRAAIIKITPDGKSKEVYASGTRNPIGLHFMPNSDQLWAAVQERDGLGDDLVPDYFTSIKPGGFYGWPYAYIGPNEDPRRKGEKPDLVAKTIVPDVPLGAHVAVLDFLFYTGKLFPKEYQGGAFLAQHGSWNRSKRVGYNVVFIPFKDGKPSGPAKEFLQGWMMDPEKTDVWGRPVGFLQLPDGSILVSDDVGNKIWHITYKS